MVTIVKLSRTHKLTENVNSKRNVRMSDTKVNKAPNNMAIESWILARLTISSTKLKVELHRSLSNKMICEPITITDILNVLLLG